jgi:hypothetical protein
MEGSSCHEVNFTDSTYVFYWTKVQLQKSRDKTSTPTCCPCKRFYENTCCRKHHNRGHEGVLPPLGLLIHSGVHKDGSADRRGNMEVITEETGAGARMRPVNRGGRSILFFPLPPQQYPQLPEILLTDRVGQNDHATCTQSAPRFFSI